MKKKGFTLIELLAVIVILAIIAVIATPIITGIIEDSKKAAFNRSVEGIIKGLEFDVAFKLGDNGHTYTITDGDIEGLDENSNVSISNTKGYSGIIRYDDKANVSYAIHNDKWCIVNEDGVTNTFEYKNNNCKISTNISAFIYNSVVPVVKGDNCVSYAVNLYNVTEERAIEDCNDSRGILDIVNDGLNNGKTLEELKTLDVVRTAEISFEKGENCENYFASDDISEEELTNFCNGENLGGLTLKDYILINTSYIETTGQDFGFDIETLQTNNVIKNVVIKGDLTITGYKEDIGGLNVIIPSTINGNNVVSIKDGAFNNKGLKSVVIPETVTNIGHSAFSSNNLTKVEIKNNNTDIKCTAFMNNSNLTQINKGGINISIDNINCPTQAETCFTTIDVEGGVSITDYDINTCGVDVVIPSKINNKEVVAIGNNAFFAKELSTELSMLDNKNNIEFMSNKVELVGRQPHGDIKSVVIPDTVKIIGDYAFGANRLTTITIPSSVTSVGDGAFRDNQLTSVVIENSNTTIGCSVFYGNDNLTTVKVAGVDKPVSAFSLCK